MNKIQYNFISRRKSANSKKFCKSKFYGFPGITESEKCMHFSLRFSMPFITCRIIGNLFLFGFGFYSFATSATLELKFFFRECGELF